MERRDADTAVADVIAAVTDFEEHLKILADAYPKLIGIAAIVLGEPCGPLLLTSSEYSLHLSPVARQRVRTLAKVVAGLPEDLLETFEIQLQLTKETNALRATIREINRQHDVSGSQGEAS